MSPAEEWAEVEAEWLASEQRRVDRMRVRGYALAICKHVDRESQAFERARERVEIAKQALLVAMRDCNAAHAHLEEVMKVIASDDDGWLAEVAGHLEEVFG